MTLSVYIGSAIWRTVEVGHMKGITALLRTPGFSYYPQTGDALIDRARGISATYFLRQTEADVHLSIDSDITGFTVEDTRKMCELAAEHGIVGGVYVCRSASRTFPATFYEDGVRVMHGLVHEVVRVMWCATGFLAVHRRVFEKLAEDLPLLHKSEGERAFYPFYLPMVYEDADTGDCFLQCCLFGEAVFG